MFLISILAFILIFGLLVLVHEAGHFWAARIFGVKVEEFAIGLPPRLKSWHKHGTQFSLGALPLGGFVRLKGETQGSETDSLAAKSPWVRLAVALAGVVMNFLLGWVILMIAFWGGSGPIVGDPTTYVKSDNINQHVEVLQIADNTAAQSAGLQRGDVIVAVNDEPVREVEVVRKKISDSQGHKLKFDILRGGQTVMATVTPRLNDGNYQVGFYIETLIQSVKYPALQVPWIALSETVKVIGAVATSFWSLLKNLVTVGTVPSDLTGPIGIAQLSGQVVQLGILQTLQFIVLLSINLGVLNILPFPALDGGRAVFVIVEVISGGKKIRPEVENWIHTAGFILLLTLIALVTYKDLVNLF